MKGHTKEEFIVKAREVHGNKYDYSKAEYVNSKTKVCIICPTHGEFWQAPENHIIQKQGCPKCSHRSYKLENEEFLKKAKEVHGDRYDYSKVKYVNNRTKIRIICQEHGEFCQTPYKHLIGQSCPKCAGKNITTQEIVERFKKIHGEKYDYTNVKYEGTETKVRIVCPTHGEFLQTPHGHLSGQGCPYCCNTKKLSKDLFIEKAKNVHGDKYDYSKVEYVNNKTKVCIVCPKHGEF